nr:uncharacterized protein LOC109172155 [Ipomoea trifida]
MKLSSDADILGLITNIPDNKELDIYVEHLYGDQWDYDVEISRELGDDTLLHDAIESEDDTNVSVSEGPDVEGVEVETNRDTATSSKGQGLDGLGKQNEEFFEVECNLSEQVLRTLCDSDSDGGVNGQMSLELLDTDLNWSNSPSAWTIISDKQNGLIPVVEELFPGLEHRFCARHMHANFLKDGFTGHVIKMQLWAVCKANTEADYHARTDELKGLNVKAFEWDKLIQTMCENIRLYLMTKMQKNRDKMRNHPFMVQQPHSQVLHQPVSQEEMSSQPSQDTDESNVIPSVSNFISSTTSIDAANEPTSRRKKYLTIGGIKFTCSAIRLN